MGLSPLTGKAARDAAVSITKDPNVNANRAFWWDLRLNRVRFAVKAEFGPGTGPAASSDFACEIRYIV